MIIISFSIQVLLLIDIELSYINTNHEDFIGFAKYVFCSDPTHYYIKHLKQHYVTFPLQLFTQGPRESLSIIILDPLLTAENWTNQLFSENDEGITESTSH